MPVAPPHPRLPSLNALRAFEAAARLGGFAMAAEELGVTAGAVTAQIKTLEADVGAPLFERHARGVRLTDVGARALPALSATFDSMAEAARSLRQDAAPRRVHVAALPALAQLWLAPRLPELRARLPGLEISVTALETPPNLKRIPFDLCLFYTAQLPATGVVLAQDHLLPVCTPELARQIATPLDLRRMVCLTDTSWADDWAIWAATAMPGSDFAPRGPVFSLYAVALQEALSGAGVLIARRSLVARHLATGKLVAPIAVTVALPDVLAAWSPPGAGTRHFATRVAKALATLE